VALPTHQRVDVFNRQSVFAAASRLVSTELNFFFLRHQRRNKKVVVFVLNKFYF
jgi:hypothetical protein